MSLMNQMARTNSGRGAQILMTAEDEGERVFLVKYQGTANKKTCLRSAKSFVFHTSQTDLQDSTEMNVKSSESIDDSISIGPLPDKYFGTRRVLISVVGVNVDLSDTQLEEINEAFHNILQLTPFTLQYDSVDTNNDEATAETPELYAVPEEKLVEEKEEEVRPAETKPSLLETQDSLNRLEPTVSVKKSLAALPESQRQTAEQIIKEIAENVASPKKTGILNPFGEPLTEADIQYAFDQCDENGDQRIQFKEFSRAVKQLGLSLSKKELQGMFGAADLDGNKVLSYNEFKAALFKLEPDQVEIWSKWLSKSVLDLKPSKNDATVEQIAKNLNTTRTDWQERIDHMHAFARKAVQPMNKKKFDAIMRPVREPLLIQLTDRRSAVVREACIVIAKICMVQQALMTRWAPRILEALFETARLNVEIMAVSAHQAAKALVRCVPDNKKNELLTKLEKASIGNHIVVRQRSFEYVNLILNDVFSSDTKKPATWWKKVMAMTAKGMADSSEAVRNEAYMVCCRLYEKNQKKTRTIVIEKLRRATQKKFMEQWEEYKANKAS